MLLRRAKGKIKQIPTAAQHNPHSRYGQVSNKYHNTHRLKLKRIQRKTCIKKDNMKSLLW